MRDTIEVILKLLLFLAIVVLIILQIGTCAPYWFSTRSITEMPWFCVSHR